MINQYPLWKYVLILVLSGIAVIYSLPNLYGKDPALQITSNVDLALDESTEARIRSFLDSHELSYKRIERIESGLLVRMRDTESQLQAKDELGAELGRGYIIALTLAPSVPGWLAALDAAPLYLGLDLQGGVHFLLEVDMVAALKQAEERYVSDIRAALREEKIRYLAINDTGDGAVRIKFSDEKTGDQAIDILRRAYPGLAFSSDETDAAYYVRAALTEDALRELRRNALQQNITTLRNRVNELGVAEPIIQQQGQSRIVVQLPGVQDPARAKEILGATATLEYRLVAPGDVQAAVAGDVPVGAKLYRQRDGTPILLSRDVIITGQSVIDAASGIDQESGSPAVFVTLDGQGAKRMGNVTKENVGTPMAVVFIENKVETRTVDGESVKSRKTIEEVISVATIREPFSKRFQTTGIGNTKEARDLALLLRAGALATPIEIVEERTVGPSLGQDNIKRGVRAVIVGFILVLVFMAIYYRAFGLVANLALAFNLIFIVAVLSILQATLTLPGIAGIVLTVGMAVDANVLIFERIREELRNGNTPQASINAGYDKAFSTISDANITTLIAAVVLFGFGTGPVKGFAVTLSIGILTSMFTAIMGTRAVVNLIYGGRRVTRLAI